MTWPGSTRSCSTAGTATAYGCCGRKRSSAPGSPPAKEWDQFLKSPVRWAEGFQLGGPSSDPTMARSMGRYSGWQTFGHNGSSCCIAWADPERRVVFAYLTNLLQAGRTGARHQAAVADAILEACD